MKLQSPLLQERNKTKQVHTQELHKLQEALNDHLIPWRTPRNMSTKRNSNLFWKQ